MTSEKRKHIRFIPKTETYAALGTSFSKVGKLKDISISGLALTYIEQTENSVQEFSKVAIFTSDNKFYLPDLSCRLIYDFPVDENNNIQYFKKVYRKKRCGVQFAATTETQLEKLKLFINHQLED
jgi:hypothetical protein